MGKDIDLNTIILLGALGIGGYLIYKYIMPNLNAVTSAVDTATNTAKTISTDITTPGLDLLTGQPGLAQKVLTTPGVDLITGQQGLSQKVLTTPGLDLLTGQPGLAQKVLVTPGYQLIGNLLSTPKTTTLTAAAISAALPTPTPTVQQRQAAVISSFTPTAPTNTIASKLSKPTTLQQQGIYTLLSKK